ncbi:MAG: hypothetical protein V4472_16010 [Pseudomonadota bacterium]
MALISPAEAAELILAFICARGDSCVAKLDMDDRFVITCFPITPAKSGASVLHIMVNIMFAMIGPTAVHDGAGTASVAKC